MVDETGKIARKDAAAAFEHCDDDLPCPPQFFPSCNRCSTITKPAEDSGVDFRCPECGYEFESRRGRLP